MRTYRAEIGEIVRAYRRDDEAVEDLQERFSSILQQTLSHRSWMKVMPFLDTAAKTTYYAATLLSGTQTLGEEYVRLLESVAPHPAVPGWMRRAIFVFLHVYAPLLVERALANAERRLAHASTTSFLGVDVGKNRTARGAMLKGLRWMRSSGSPALHRLHIALFYIFGAYYQISRRVLGIRFVSFSPQSDIAALKVYRILGWVTLAEAAASVALWLYAENRKADERLRKRREAAGKAGTSSGDLIDKEDDDEEEEDEEKYSPCTVCACSRPPACPPCGHVACWTCLATMATSAGPQSPPKCPHCRLPYQPQQIVPLLNL